MNLFIKFLRWLNVTSNTVKLLALVGLKIKSVDLIQIFKKFFVSVKYFSR